jgi:hypothetical protein
LLGREQREIGFKRGDQIGFAVAFAGNAKRGDGCAEQVTRFQLRANQLGRHDLLVVDVVEQGAHEGGLAGADVASDDDEAFSLVQAKFQVRQRAAVPLAVKEEAGVRVEQEGGAGEAEMVLVHGCLIAITQADEHG